MPYAELLEWGEYAAIEPFGSHYDDLRSGSITAAVYNVNRNHEMKPEPWMPLEFAPWNSLRKVQTSEPAKVVHGDDLTPEQHSALLRAVMFGKA